MLKILLSTFLLFQNQINQINQELQCEEITVKISCLPQEIIDYTIDNSDIDTADIGPIGGCFDTVDTENGGSIKVCVAAMCKTKDTIWPQCTITVCTGKGGPPRCDTWPNGV